MKLWDKGYEISKIVEEYTVQNDYLLDKKLLKYDCMASIAHAEMLNASRLITDDELKKLTEGLNEIIDLDGKDKFVILQGDEDCHTAIEKYLTEKYGETGKKIHTARSRNDQILAALRLYEKDKLTEIREMLKHFITTVSSAVGRSGDTAIPGYTHMQRAMPSTIALWLSCFKDSAGDNIKLLDTILEIIDQSPLGTAAGFGVPVLDIDRKLTADLLGFAKVQENPYYTQMSRGKFEASILHLCGTIMFDLNKLASDFMLFTTSEFGFIELPKTICTGSSIMPQKKNPDLLELLRAKYHVVLGEEFKVKGIIANLISGYNRDVQLTKEPLLNTIDITMQSISIASVVLEGFKVNDKSCKDAMTDELYATEEVYKLVKAGKSFRSAYKEVAERFKD